MICPLCKEKGIRVVSPCWLENKIVEACRDCVLNLKLKGVNVMVDKEGIPHWKADIPAIIN